MLKKIVPALLLIYPILGFLVLPPIIKSQLESIVAKETNSKLSINDIRFNPFSFKVEVSGLSLKTLEDKKIASFEKLEVNLQPLSLFRFALHLKSITLKKPEIFVLYNQDKTLNLSKIFKEKNEALSENAKEPLKLPRVIIDSVKVEEGILNYEDFTTAKKFELSLKPIDFKLINMDTDSFDSNRTAFRFYSALDEGGEIDLRGRIASYKPLKLDGNLNLDEIKLYTIWRYIQEKIALEVADGVMFLSADYHINFDDLNSTKVDEAYLSLDNLRVKPKDKNSDILNLKSLYADSIAAKPMMQDLYIRNVVLDQLKANIKRDAKGDIDWTEYFKIKEKISESKKVQKDEKTAPLSIAVEDISLKRTVVNIEDKSVIPNVKTKLNELNLDIKNFTLSAEKPFSYKMNLVLNDKTVCSSNGDIKDKFSEANTRFACKNLDVVHYRPYIEQIASNMLKSYDILLKSSMLNFDANVTLKDENSEIAALVKSANLSIDNFALNHKKSDENLVNFKSFDVNGVSLDTKTKAVTIEKASFGGLEANLKREKSGAFNFENLIEVKPNISNSVKTDDKKDEKAYRVKLKLFNINSAKISFNDKSIEKNAKTTLDKIDFSADDIDSKENSLFKYNLAFRVNSRGTVKSGGEIKHTPLEQKGRVAFHKISLKELTPYIEEFSFLKISDGYLNLNSTTSYGQKDKKHNLNVDGELSVEEFFLHDGRDDSTIASFSKADLKSFNFKTAPNSLYIDEALLDSFYLDAMIYENKSMNLAKLLKPKERESQKVSQKSDKAKTIDDEKFAFRLLKLKVSNGSANFADYSLPIDFKTSIHDLNGNIYAVSNSDGEVAYVDVDGGVDEYGSAKLKGSFEPSNIKSFLDIDFNFRNLNLNALSGYSAQFAGYKIDKGKLFLDLKYRINNSELLSKNNIVIKNMKLGDEIEDKNITKLPLGFAIALLENSDGVIDIDMPIEGNVDKPDFKYGTIIMKALSKLILKAVASPFTFLGKLIGIEGDKLKNIDFEAGESSILPPEREKLDNLADILLKKPKLSLAISGGFDGEKDLEALKSKKLKEKVFEISKQEQPTIQILARIYVQSGGDIKSLLDELRAKTGRELSNGEYQKELYTRCINAQIVAEGELNELADKRAKIIQNYLAETKKIDVKKVILDKAKSVSDSQENLVKTALKIEVK
ncbi:MAG: DUF748 domain-containing protein [Sulfurimonas sp.]|uniref:DUF748 domain-containing protein n=1 Tax=Sulfurimonas sp. TaxID=2022749 RepID=UPI00260E2E45|nr:DUF748 domain-containing protein [Sulfurimonas sp.]MDD5373006.1 DUF748 domain-containing protein [Sulfurimonas sp.]